MSVEEVGGLSQHSHSGDEETEAPTGSQCLEQTEAAVGLVAAKEKNEDSDVDVNEDKDSSHEISVKVDNKRTYFKRKLFSNSEVINKAGHVKGRKRFINIGSNRTELVGSSVKGQVSRRTSEHTTITTGHLSSGSAQSTTARQVTMGSMVCGYSELEDKADKRQESSKKRRQEKSHDPNKTKIPSPNTGRHQSSTNVKRYHQPTLDHYEIRTRTAQRTHQERNEKARLHKHVVDRDTESYRNGYPGKEDNPHLNDNLRFYRGEIMSVPRGAYIDDIHENWWGDYKLLESHHGYIQWLFPIRESGMNSKAQPLQLHEAKAIKADKQAKKRVLMSYRLMLDFYGMELTDDQTGKLKRSQNWRKCYDNLNRSPHNYLRITRILKCLGELGYEHLKKGLLQFVLEEALIHQTLGPTLASCRDYWIGTIKDVQDREDLYQFIEDHQGSRN
ncbi:unnamed protein product [Candidula unifasciata]|uniref:Opioid growth factor receptor (OGFr) conserved domain-containing protein n=1 Tax=Candidula unifasciata TaxID=100452 RepID=A0A8S3ZMW6_9EUPU|nr:unnamed protein product [Candidula unifasciata]